MFVLQTMFNILYESFMIYTQDYRLSKAQGTDNPPHYFIYKNRWNSKFKLAKAEYVYYIGYSRPSYNVSMYYLQTNIVAQSRQCLLDGFYSIPVFNTQLQQMWLYFKSATFNILLGNWPQTACSIAVFSVLLASWRNFYFYLSVINIQSDKMQKIYSSQNNEEQTFKYISVKYELKLKSR